MKILSARQIAKKWPQHSSNQENFCRWENSKTSNDNSA